MSLLGSDLDSHSLERKLLALEGVSRLPQCPRGTAIYSAKDRPEYVYFLESGRVKVLKKSVDGKEVLLSIIEAGELFGEHAVLGDEPWGAFAEVLDDAVVYLIPKEVLLGFCRDNPPMSVHLLTLVNRRRRELEQKVELLLFYEVEARILRSLESLARYTPGPDSSTGVWSVHLSQKEFASLIGSTRETTSSALNNLSKQGLIRLQRRRVIIPSIAAVQSAVGGRSDAAVA